MSMFMFAVFFDGQTNLGRSISVMARKSLNEKRRAYFSKIPFVGSHFFACRTRAGTKAKNSQRKSLRKRV